MARNQPKSLNGRAFHLKDNPKAQIRVIMCDRTTAKVHDRHGKTATVEVAYLKKCIAEGALVEIENPDWGLLQWRY